MSGRRQDRAMNDAQVGRAFRAVRVRRGLRQADVAVAAGVSQTTVSRLERGRLGSVPLDTLRRVAEALGMRVSLVAAWEGAELDRLLGGRHSAMHEAVARDFGRLPEWVTAPEVTFAVFGERGAIDILAWHAPTRTLLVIELKTELVDVQDTLGTLDRKCRLAARIAAERGWEPLVVGRWLLVADSATNRRRVAAHRAVLRSALPADGRTITGWLAAPRGSISALSFLASSHATTATRGFAPVHRVRRRRTASGRPGTAPGVTR
jgi:transcriptional regulator with XRE-family HTH domain